MEYRIKKIEDRWVVYTGYIQYGDFMIDKIAFSSISIADCYAWIKLHGLIISNSHESSFLTDIKTRFDSDIFIENLCLSYRHDFGLMAEQDKQRLRFDCKEWLRAIINNW